MVFISAWSPRRLTQRIINHTVSPDVGGSHISVGSRTECVVDIDHIEPGRFAAVFAVDSSTDLLVVELTDDFASEDQAWQSQGSSAFPHR